MSAKKLLELLDKNGLLEDAVMAELRKQVSDSKGKVTAETIAKALVDKGHLTKFQATRLVGEATVADETKVEAKTARKSDDDLLGLAPLDDDEPAAPTPPPTPSAKPVKGSKPGKDEPKKGESRKESRKAEPKKEEIVMLEDADALTPVEDAGAALTPVGHTAIAAVPGLEPLGGALEELDSPDPFATPAGRGSEASVIRPKKRETRWDTKLMLGGFGTLAVLIVIGTMLVMWLWSEPTIKIWEAAEEAYNSGNFTDAKEKYEMYLAAVGEKGENASKARVRVHLTRLRNDIGDPERGLKTAKELLPMIDEEEDSTIARDEFPGFLPQIPEGFIKRARQAKDTASAEELVTKAREARDLLHNPGVITSANRVKVQPQLTRIDEDIAILERGISQDKELAETVQKIDGALTASDTIQGYELYTELLKKYPGLKNDAGLATAVGKIAARERTLVKVKQEVLAPQNSDDARRSEFRIVLATRTAGDAKLQSQVATFRYGHSVYGLDAGTGQILWSRYVGDAGRANPVRVAAQPDADVLIVDAQRHELLRLKPLDGKLVWRLPVAEPFTEPTVAGTRAYVATNSGKSGRVLEVDLETGESKRHVLIQQPLTVSPAVSADRPRMYQVGDHSNVYVIHTDSMQCEDVIYLGHKAGGVDTTPLILMGHVFIAESSGTDYSLVHAFRVRSQGEGPKLFRPQEALRTQGRVVVPLAAYGRRLLILTDRGEMRVFDVDATKTENTLGDTGKLPPTLPVPHVGYPLADGNTIWLADDKLTKYTVQVTKKEIVRDPAITNVGDAFVAPLQLFGNYLIHARRSAGSTGVTVACIHVDDPRKTIWQTQLGVPAGRVAVDSAKKEIVAISSSASLFVINGNVLKAGYTDQPVQSVAPGNTGLSFTEPVEFNNGLTAFFNPVDNKQLLIYDPATPTSRLKLIPLALQDGQVPCLPIAFLGGLLVPSNTGDVWLFKTSDGTPQALPFRPKLEPGEKLQWRQPATVGAGAAEFIIADDRRNIYRVAVKDQPQPHLAELLSNRLDVQLDAAIAVVGETVYGVVRTADKGDSVVAISASDLKQVKDFDLKGGRVTWGPVRVGDVVMVVTDAKELRLYDATQKERWEKPAVMHGNPAGPPLIAGENYVFAAVQGAVWSLVAASGQELGMTQLGEPLGASPVAYQDRLLLCGNDGTLHVIPTPSASAAGATGAGGQ